MKKLLVILAILALFAFPVPAKQQAEDIFYADSLLLDLRMSSYFTLTGSSDKIDYAKAIMYFFPEASASQEVISLETVPNADRNKDYLEFYWSNPAAKRYDYSLDSNVRTHNRFAHVSGKIRFPLSGLSSDAAYYLQKTEKIDINDEIIRKASELAEGEDDLSVIVFKLASWTKENINYSITTATADASQKASWVLQNRYGVCDELTNLFISFCRSLGIPARFVSGISYTNSELFSSEWGLHGWAEVYFPGYGWVPYDPTYGQYGYIDAGHIKLKDSIDSDKSSTKFEWQGSTNLNPGTMDVRVDVLEYGSRLQNYAELSLSSFAKQVGFGSYNILSAEFENKNSYYIAFEATLTSTKEITKLSPSTTYLVMPPNSKKTVHWMVKVSEKLSKGYAYTFPFDISTSLGENIKSSFSAADNKVIYSLKQITAILDNLEDLEKKTYSGSLDFKCNSPKSVYINDTFEIFCDFENKGNVFLKNLNVCISSCKSIDIGISQSKNITFAEKLMGKGEQELIITAKNKEVSGLKKLDIIVEDYPKLSIRNVIVPNPLRYEDFEINFDVSKESLSSPRNAKISVLFNGRKTEWNMAELDATQKYTLSLDPTSLAASNNKLTIEAAYYDRNNKIYEETYEKDLEIENLNLFQRFILWISGAERYFENLLP